MKVEIPFTVGAKRVLELSWDEARKLGHNYIGSEHLMLAILRENECVAYKVMQNLGVNFDEVQRRVMRLIGG